MNKWQLMKEEIKRREIEYNRMIQAETEEE